MFLHRLRRFDLYTKPVEDCRVKTPFGGIITLISFVVIILLFITETWSYLSVDVIEQLFVDSTSAEMRIEIHFDITLHKLSCPLDDVFKQRLDSQGNIIEGAKPEKQVVNTNTSKSANVSRRASSDEECGSCYGAINGCCNTCEEVREAYRLRGWVLQNIDKIEQCKNDAVLRSLSEQAGEGCRVWGKVDVGKVGGNFHIAPGVPSTHANSHFHDFHSVSPARFDASHTINHLSFGKPFPGKMHPLDGKQFITNKGGIMHQYQLKIVPTRYIYGVTRKGETLISHQFAITRVERDIMAGASGIPGLFVQYEFSPLMVQYEERKRPLSFFLVSLCAIIGGVHTVAALLDATLYNTQRAIQRKMAVAKSS
uniref:Endoplasmic reticulum-Golgi intermediate compartment protein 3 n=1 Tax=Globodera pallida TaxID=36090 RepID=A0A183C818_GLOPA